MVMIMLITLIINPNYLEQGKKGKKGKKRPKIMTEMKLFLLN